jgi:hypothetical protein
MAEPEYLNLESNEIDVLAASARIYAAYIGAGRVAEGSEAQWMERSVAEAISLAKRVDARVLAKGEMT